MATPYDKNLTDKTRIWNIWKVSLKIGTPIAGEKRPLQDKTPKDATKSWSIGKVSSEKKGEHSQPKKDEKPVMLEFHKPESTFTSYHLYQGKSQTSIKLPWYLLLINTQRPLHLQGLPQVQMWNSFFPNHGRSSAAEVPEMKRDLQPRVSGRFSFTEPPSSLVKPNPCPLRGKLAQAPGV